MSAPSALKAKATERAVPYYCQWESAALAASIVTGESTPADDPLWQTSGAFDQQEYITWANHVCGMACFKMVWEALTGRTIPTLELARAATQYGAYTVDDTGIHGMIYAPFVTFLREEFDLEARIEIGRSARDLEGLMDDGAFFIASVHPTIRWLDQTPSAKGGHLILVTAADEETITFHNPSGDTPQSQEDVQMSYEDFDRFFAGRGVLILGEIAE